MTETMVNESQIEEVLDRLFSEMKFTAEPAGLYDPLRYMMALGGKRVRPRLCLTVYSLYKDAFTEEILSPAAALEVFHSFTLIHDDIMDNAEMRRGELTVCRKWGDNTAILSGDVMSIESYRMIAEGGFNYVLGRPDDTLVDIMSALDYSAENGIKFLPRHIDVTYQLDLYELNKEKPAFTPAALRPVTIRYV